MMRMNCKTLNEKQFNLQAEKEVDCGETCDGLLVFFFF